jgi:lipopolysaccharide export system protein LptC
MIGAPGAFRLDMMASLAPHDERDVSGFAVMRESDRGRAFRRAKRHSRQIRFMRLAIPGSIVLAAAVAPFVTQFEPLRMLTGLSGLPVDIGSLVISGSKITMQQPRIAGFTRDSRPYELTAHAAAQDVTKPDTIELQGLSGTTEMTDHTVMSLTAASGIYETKTDRLTLKKDVVLKSSGGIAVRLSEAVVDIKSGNVVSDKPVQVDLAQGSVSANHLEVAESGDMIRFDGEVTMVLRSGNRFLHIGGNLGVP